MLAPYSTELQWPGCRENPGLSCLHPGCVVPPSLPQQQSVIIPDPERQEALQPPTFPRALVCSPHYSSSFIKI